MRPLTRVVLLALAAVLAGCDTGVSEPREQIVTLSVTVAGDSASRIGAILLSADAAIDTITVGGRGLLAPDGVGTLVAAVPHSPDTAVTFTLKGTGSAPAMRLLQVAGPDNALYPDLTAFSVDVVEEE